MNESQSVYCRVEDTKLRRPYSVLSCLNNILGKAKLQGTDSSSVVARAGHGGGNIYNGASRRNLGVMELFCTLTVVVVVHN